MRKFKKVNYGLLIAAALIVTVLTYVIIATVINHVDEDKIRDVVLRFTDSFVAVNKGNKDNGTVDVNVFHEALKQYYKGDVDSSPALDLRAGGYDFDAMSKGNSSVTVNYSSFTKASVSAELRNVDGYRIVSLSFDMVKVNGVWKIVSWEVGNRNDNGWFI